MSANLVALYVPGSRPDRFEKAAASGAEMILDLEDSVAAADKAQARLSVASWLAHCEVPVQVRVNAPGSAALAADLEAIGTYDNVRLPKVERASDLDVVAGRRVHALIETALGVENVFAIASAPQVVSVALGEADLAAELGLDGEDAFAWVRSRLVVAARAAGLPAPMMSAYADLANIDGLRESCRIGRALGMRGRTAVHPRQVEVIRSVFAPADTEESWARQVLAALGRSGVATLDDGSMVDKAMALRAEAILEQCGPRSS